MGPQVNPGSVPSTPVTIVNIPTPPTPVGAHIAARPAMTHQPPPAALQTFSLPSTDDRKDQKGGQAVWIPDPDEEYILYYADFSSDIKEFLYVADYPDDDEDILYCMNNPYDDEVMYDADVSDDTDDISLPLLDDHWEEDSFSSGTSTLILNPATLLQDRASP
ncbi:hypothetical protein OUZ56_026487 [Daphnia magna]|uniref:Uncharacterized protein n=1 Tax=Daphnia magna TaxID=35525 RepID=A0ABQ9ZLW3_9CRUS|nr:hypothetical protein OUZ56_026487 [Daphnia magna]